MHILICILTMTHKEKLPERYHDMIALYARGHANSAEILKTDFGHWPPNNLDIVRTPDIDVEFRSSLATKYGLKSVIPKWYESAFLLNIFMGSPLKAAAYYSGLTTLKLLSLGGFVSPEAKPTTVHANDAYRLLGGFQGGRRYFSHILAHEFKHVVQVRDSQESLSSSLDDRTEIAAMLKKPVWGHTKYLAEECEMQARLHTIMVGAYHQFEAMPTTKSELLVCLASQKIDVPEDVLEKIRASEGGEAIFEKFAHDEKLYDRYADKSAVSDINSVVKKVKVEFIDKFWGKTFPYIYGDLLELYGDSQGLKRMGRSHNAQLREVFYKSASDAQDIYDDVLAAKKEHGSIEGAQAVVNRALRTMKGTLAIMPKADALQVARKVIVGEEYRSHGDSVTIAHQHDTVGKMAISAIYNRADMTAYDKGQINRTYKAFMAEAGTPSRLSRRMHQLSRGPWGGYDEGDTKPKARILAYQAA